MIALSQFLITVVLVSASGVLSPGPLFIVTLERAVGSRGRSGLDAALGHTVVELPLVLGLAVGALVWLQNSPLALKVIGLVGGVVLLFFAGLQVWEAKTGVKLENSAVSQRVEEQSGRGIFFGILFTAMNPFFIVWWLTVGWSLIVQASLLGALVGVLVMYLAHVWMDFAWLGGTGFIASRRKLSLGPWFRILLIVFAAAMAYFGLSFIASSVS